jgi:hypothetical protein
MALKRLGPENLGLDVTEENRAAHIAALLRERSDYETVVNMAEAGGDEDRAKRFRSRLEQVDSSLKEFGHKAATPAKRAEKRPRKKAEER